MKERRGWFVRRKLRGISVDRSEAASASVTQEKKEGRREEGREATYILRFGWIERRGEGHPSSKEHGQRRPAPTRPQLGAREFSLRIEKPLQAV